MPQYRNLERSWLISALLALAVFAAYLPVFYLGFINFDDTLYVTHNHSVQRGLTWSGLSWAFSHFDAANWHPLTWLSHMLDCQIYGLSPVGHHITSVLFHAANTVVLFLWLRQLTGAVWRSALVAAIFALHPLRVESVAWVAERKDVLSTFFGLLSLWAYTQYARASGLRLGKAEAHPKNRTTSAAPNHPSKLENSRNHIVRLYTASLLLLLLGLLSKPMLVTWPFVMLLLDFWPLGRINATDLHEETPEGERRFRLKRLMELTAEKLPFFALSAASCVITFLAQRAGGALSALEGAYGLSIESRLSNLPISYIRYLWKLVWPHDLAVIYPLVKDWPEEQVIAATFLLALVTGMILWRARRNPYLPVGWFWYLGTAVPVIGLVQVGTQSIADRYTYIPAIGLCIVVVWGLFDLALRWRPGGAILATTAATLLLAFTYVDGRQLLYWQNSESLFRHALAVTKKNYMADALLGSYLSELGDLEPAKAHYRAALQIAPELPSAWNNLGCAMVAQKQYAEAAEAFERVIRSKPHLADAQSNLGNALFGLGRFKEAIEHFREAVRIDPEDARAQYNLGNALSQNNQLEEGIHYLQMAIKLDPRYPEAHIFLAGTFVRQGKLDEAATEYQRALAIAPTSLSALYGYASLMASQGKWDEAARQYQAIVHLVSNDNQARLNLGIAQAAQGKVDDAIDSLAAVLRASPNNVLANYQMAAAMADQHRFKEAIQFYRTALKSSPDLAEAMNNLAWILASCPDGELRNGAEAVQLAERACQLTEYKQAVIVGTLAAAYAEAGRFPEAITAAEKARTIAETDGENAVVARNTELLELYRSGKPYRDTR